MGRCQALVYGKILITTTELTQYMTGDFVSYLNTCIGNDWPVELPARVSRYNLVLVSLLNLYRLTLSLEWLVVKGIFCHEDIPY